MTAGASLPNNTTSLQVILLLPFPIYWPLSSSGALPDPLMPVLSLHGGSGAVPGHITCARDPWQKAKAKPVIMLGFI